MNPAPKDPSMPTPFHLNTPNGGWKPIAIRHARVLVSPVDGGMLVGRCLEHNLVVQGSSYEELADALSHVLVTQCILDQVDGVEQLSTLPEAAAEYWKAWENADAVNVPSTQVTVAVLKTEARIQADFKVARPASAA